MSSKKHEGRITKITTPSPYGSHSSMLYHGYVDFEVDENFVVCEDDIGLYITEKNRIDSGLADPYRYSITRKLKKLSLT